MDDMIRLCRKTLKPDVNVCHWRLVRQCDNEIRRLFTLAGKLLVAPQMNFPTEPR